MTGEAPDRCSWVVVFGCPGEHTEAIIVEHLTEAEARECQDGLGCPAVEVHPMLTVTFEDHPWTHDGYLRCRVKLPDGRIVG